MTLDLSKRDRCFVIAEAGTCHAHDDPGERRTIAHLYVGAAADAGADCVKFQMFNDPIRDDMFCWIDGDEEREPRWRDSALSLSDWAMVKQHADDRGIMFLASVFQHSTVAWLNELGVEATKVASRAAKDFPYGDAPAPYLISTGMGRAGAKAVYCSRYYLLCEANYPSTRCWRDETLSLGGCAAQAMDRAEKPGFSDHSGTPWRAIDAISRGCPLVEVHFYIDKEDAGPDLPASLTTDQLAMVCEARDAFVEMRKQQ